MVFAKLSMKRKLHIRQTNGILLQCKSSSPTIASIALTKYGVRLTKLILTRTNFEEQWKQR